jgi:thiosulfate/3-mercaptopyruvate sulfurtransferase
MPTRSLILVAAGVLAAVLPASAQSRLLSTTDLAARLTDKNLVVLFVGGDRDRSAFDNAHIPGARFIAYGEIAVDGDGIGSELPPPEQLKKVLEDAGVSDSSQVVIYGNTVSAARLFFTLDAAGHQRVAVLDGGFRAWQAEGRPVESGAGSTSHAKGRFTPKIDASRVATADWIQRQQGSFALVDVRPDAEFTGSDGRMNGIHATGHIDDAKQLP